MRRQTELAYWYSKCRTIFKCGMAVAMVSMPVAPPAFAVLTLFIWYRKWHLHCKLFH